MSLAIRTKNIVAVYALGQWHDVAKGSFEIDTYELFESLDGEENARIYYELGYAYPENREIQVSQCNSGTLGENWSFASPQGFHGCQWVDPESREIVSMSMLEIKAWKEASE